MLLPPVQSGRGMERPRRVGGTQVTRRLRQMQADDGASAVEFALIFPIFMILVLGTIAAGTAFSRQINVTQAAREASRYGSTFDIASINAGAGSAAARTALWLSSVDGALTQSGGAATNPIGGYDYRCVAIVVTDTSGVPTTGTTYMENGGTATPNTGKGCPSTSAAVIKSTSYVQVVLSRNVQFFVLFANPTLHLDAVSTTPYEGKLP